MSDLSNARCLFLDSPTQPPGWRWDPETGSARLSDPAPSWRGVASPAAVPAPPDARASGPGDFAAPATGAQDPTLQMASARFAHIVAETLSGQRRVTQLESLFDSGSLKVLTENGKKLKGLAVRLASVRVQPMSDLSAEVTLRLATNTFDHAAALRVTGRSGRWMCTDLVMG